MDDHKNFFEMINDMILSSVAGSLLFMVKNNLVPWWERISYFILGSIAAYFSAEAVVKQFHLDPGVRGAVGFFAGVLVLPLIETLFKFIKEPDKLADLIDKVKNGSRTNNSGEDDAH